MSSIEPGTERTVADRLQGKTDLDADYSKSSRVGILVVGMHRSGTSLLTRILSLLGCSLPATLLPGDQNNESGYWESREVMRLNDSILESIGSHWCDWESVNRAWMESNQAIPFIEHARAIVQSEFSGKDLFVLKDPRVSRLLPFWTRVLCSLDIEPRVVIALRSPDEVSRSLKRRNGVDVDLGRLIWLRHLLDAEADSRAVRRAFVGYDDLFRSWKNVANRLESDLAVTWPRRSSRVEVEIDDAIQPQLRHYKEGADENRRQCKGNDLVSAAYGVLDRWCQGHAGVLKTDSTELERIRRELDLAARTFSKPLRRGLKVMKRHEELEREVSTLQEAVRSKEADCSEVREELAKTSASYETVSRKMAESKKEISRIESERDRMKERLMALKRELEAGRGEKGEYECTDARLRSRLKEQGRRMNTLEERIKKRDRELDAIKGSRSWRVTGIFRNAIGVIRPCIGRRGRRQLAWTPLRQKSASRSNPPSDSGPDSQQTYTVNRARAFGKKETSRAGHWLARKDVNEGVGSGAALPEEVRGRARSSKTALCKPENEAATPSEEGRSKEKHVGATRGKKDRRKAATDAGGLRFDRLMVAALFRPTAYVPYAEEQVYFHSVMESYRKFLCRQYEAKPQDQCVSVVMPTHNRAHCIHLAIDSVIAQTYSNWELVIIDDASTDRTEEIISTYSDPRIKYRRLCANKGSAAARNVGLEALTGEYVAYLDSDNTFDREFILILMNELRASPEYDVVYCAQRGYKHSSGADHEAFVRFAPFSRSHLENRNYIDIGVVMHRASMLADEGGFNERMQRLADWEWILRYTDKKAAKAVPVLLSNYVHGAENQNTRRFSYDEGLEHVDRALRRAGVSDSLPWIGVKGVELMYENRCVPQGPSRMRPVTIVIPSFELVDYLAACVQSVQEYTEGALYRLVIVDNGSSAAVVDYLEGLSERGEAEVILNKGNYGFTYAVNQGIKSAGCGSDVVLLNNDAVVTRGWLEGLQEALEACPEAGLVVPRQTVLPGEKTLRVHQPGQDPNRECDINLSHHHDNVVDVKFGGAGGYLELSYAPFFCVYIPQKTLTSLGPLDVEEGPHYRSDRLYCDLVRNVLKRRIIYTPHSKLYHFVQRATSELKSTDSSAFEDMFVKNDWKAIESRVESCGKHRKIIGSIDSVRGGYITGWCVDYGRASEAVRVSIMSNGNVVAEGVADRPRRNLPGIAGESRNGFRLALDRDVLNGEEHEFELRIRGGDARVEGRSTRRLVAPVAPAAAASRNRVGEVIEHVGGVVENGSWLGVELDVLGECKAAKDCLRGGRREEGLALAQRLFDAVPQTVLYDIGVLEALEEAGEEVYTFEEAMQRRHDLWFGASTQCESAGGGCCKTEGYTVEGCPFWQRQFAHKEYMGECARALGIRTPEVYKEFERPDEFDPRELPNKYVVKPDGFGSGKGVFAMSGGIELHSGCPISRKAIVSRLAELQDRKPGVKFHVEELVEQRGAGGAKVLPLDYKVHVFGGRAALIEVIDRNVGWMNRRCYSRNWHSLGVPIETKYPRGQSFPKPELLDDILWAAERLYGITQCYARMDLYETNTGVVFGEVTILPQNGKNFTDVGLKIMSQLWCVYGERVEYD